MGYRYIGSKARIVNSIIEYIGTPESRSARFVDAMCGTGVVACEAAKVGWSVVINDKMKNATDISEARLLSIKEVKFEKLGGYQVVIDKLNAVKPVEGFFWKEYSPASVNFTPYERRYFTEGNAKLIDGIRIQIAEWYSNKEITEKEHTLLLANLMSATNDVANIAGTYGCFLSKWTRQSQRSLHMICSDLFTNTIEYKRSCNDVFELDCSLNDYVYIDPPYTKRQYASYYHILETIAQEDEPTVEGVAGLRSWEKDSSVFCYKLKAQKALVKLLNQLTAKKVILSYSDDGHVDIKSLKNELYQTGSVEVINLRSIGSYRPNQTAVTRKSQVDEYLIVYMKGTQL